MRKGFTFPPLPEDGFGRSHATEIDHEDELTRLGLNPYARLSDGMPAVYQQDSPMAMSILEAFDQILGPAHAVQANLAAHLDSATCPRDFLTWMAGWFGIDVDASQREAQLRTFVGSLGDMLKQRGTRDGITDAIRLHTGLIAEVVDSGACEWIAGVDGALPGNPEPLVVVIIPGPVSNDLVERIEEIIVDAKPPWLRHELRVSST